MMTSLENFSFDSLTGVLMAEASDLGIRPWQTPGKSIYVTSHKTGRTVHFTTTGHDGAGWTYIPTGKGSNVESLIIFND